MKADQRRPAPRFLAIAAGLFAAALALESWGLYAEAMPRPLGIGSREILAAVALLVACVACVDWLRIRSMPAPDVKRILPRSFALKTWSDVQLEIRMADSLGPHAQIVDGVPMPAEIENLPLALGNVGRAPLRGHYQIRPLERGDAYFDQPTLRADSPFGLWRFTARVGSAETAQVFPNFAATARFDLLLSEARTAQAGIRRRQRRGEGLEFHQLREYRPGDSLRQIDWKATSRKRELISRQFEDERDQRVVFLLDCSRRMRTKDGELSHFDHGLNAMILLSHVALRGGDSVGMMSFGEDRRWLSPAKGASSVRRLLETVYDLEPTTLGVDFRGAAEDLCLRQRRRSLIVILTHLRREDLEDLRPALRLMRRTHLVLVVNLRQQELDEALAAEPTDTAEAFTALGAWSHELDRRELHERMRGEGIQTLDVTPQQLGPAIVSRYYAIKHSGLL